MKVGDKVVIKKDLKDSVSNDVVPEMLEYAGMTATIMEIYDADVDDDDKEFLIDLDDEFWTWNTKMIQEEP